MFHPDGIGRIHLERSIGGDSLWGAGPPSIPRCRDFPYRLRPTFHSRDGDDQLASLKSGPPLPRRCTIQIRPSYSCFLRDQSSMSMPVNPFLSVANKATLLDAIRYATQKSFQIVLAVVITDLKSNWCELLLVRSLSAFVFWYKISFRRVAIAHQRARRRLQMVDGRNSFSRV